MERNITRHKILYEYYTTKLYDLRLIIMGIFSKSNSTIKPHS